MKISVVLVVLAALLGLGCAQGSKVLVFSYEGSDEGLDAARAAAEEWSTTCGRTVVVNRDPGNVPMREVAAIEHGAGYTDTDADGRVLQVALYAGADDKVGTAAHEMGHALGLPHLDHGLMMQGRALGTRVTTFECEQLVRD